MRLSAGSVAAAGPLGAAAPPPALEMRPILLVMRSILVLPLSFSAGGRSASFSWRSRAVVLGVPAWCVVILVSVREAHLRVGAIYTAPTFSESVFQTFFLTALHQHFLTPFIHWPAASEFDKYLQEWTDFQTRFRKVAGRPLLLSVRSLALHRAAAVVGVPALITVVWSFDANSGGSVFNVPLGFLAAAFHAGVPALWDVVASAVVNGSESLRLSFAEELARTAGVPSAATVRQYRELWLDVRSLAERAPTAWRLGVLHYMMCCVSAALINGFAALAAVTQPGNVQVYWVSALLLVTVDSLWHTFIICHGGHRIAQSVNSGFRRLLLGMRTGAGPEGALQHAEVRSFLNVMRDPVEITLFGFITLENALILSVVQMVAIYNCVLLQFTINFQLTPSN